MYLFQKRVQQVSLTCNCLSVQMGGSDFDYNHNLNSLNIRFQVDFLIHLNSNYI